MLIFLFILIVIVAVLLILAILIQNPKGGGLTAGLNTNQVIGARKATDVVEKATWTFGFGLMALCLLTAIVNPSATADEPKSAVQEQFQNDPNSFQMPAGTPSMAPQQQPQPEQPAEGE